MDQVQYMVDLLFDTHQQWEHVILTSMTSNDVFVISFDGVLLHFWHYPIFIPFLKYQLGSRPL